MADVVPATWAIIPTFPFWPTCSASASAACAPALRLLVATKLAGISEFTPESKVTTLIPGCWRFRPAGQGRLHQARPATGRLAFVPWCFRLTGSARRFAFHRQGQRSWFCHPTLCGSFRPHFDRLPEFVLVTFTDYRQVQIFASALLDRMATSDRALRIWLVFIILLRCRVGRACCIENLTHSFT